MIPLEIQRPWIKSNAGKKIVAASIFTIILSFTILFAVNSFQQGTVNIQQINVNVTGSFNESYSVAYGKDTMNSGSLYTITVPLYVPSSASLPVYIKHLNSSNGFNAILSGAVALNNHGTIYISIVVKALPENYAGPLNLTIVVQ
ncbi:MAG: hypothetical protein M1460_04250 [Candidatus Thermoplasmatota archaeon]|jgi:hypothetical protein|nr:hypothetical protein [Candidatus Thermoplasmatota archaeon]MCL5987465.1 hypothetical protein [Candidatus Thermoplasmatota archaeon]